VSFDQQTHGVLSAIAHENDATIAWVVRRAVADYVTRHQAAAEPELSLQRPARVSAPASR
jgi:predicted transcriptional regulator